MKKQIFILTGLFTLFIAGVLTLFALKGGGPKLPLYFKISEESLDSHLGKKVDLKSFKGKVTVADFIYTRCDDLCPRLNSAMSALQSQFSQYEKFQLVSISADPDFDTAEVLSSYVKTKKISDKNWVFLTTEKEKLIALMNKNFKLGHGDKPAMHSDRLVLLDEGLNVRGFYSVGDKKALLQLKKDLQQLLKQSPVFSAPTQSLPSKES